MTALPDSILLQRVAGGDTVSFDTLFYRHYDRVYGILFRLVGSRTEAEDLTQEVFVRLHDYATRRRVRESDNIGAWLYRVATNLGYNAIRDRRRMWERDIHLVPDLELPGAEQEVVRRQEATAVRVALARLKPREAQLLVLRQMGFSYAECAEICGVAPGSVGTLLARAAESFRKAYADGGAGKEKRDERA